MVTTSAAPRSSPSPPLLPIRPKTPHPIIRDPSLLPNPIFPVSEQSPPIPDSTLAPAYAIRTTNHLVAVEPEVAKILGLASISRTNNELPENATFDELIDKVQEYAGYFELYVCLCNEPLKPFRIPDDPIAVSILRANQIAKLYHINLIYLHFFVLYPCYTFHIVNQLMEALQNEQHLPYRNFDYPFHYNHLALIQPLELVLVNQLSTLNIHFLPLNNPFRVKYPLQARFESTQQHGHYIQPVLNILDGIDDTVPPFATFTESGLANRLVFEGLKAEICLALCLYFIDPRDWCTYITAGYLYFFTPTNSTPVIFCS
ncbi:hypothetical protein ONZ51_g11985 [Trametes cubensis]|uniref:Uncharacterized protein n=1 Tax=Trametes cubensis TaxID=1111947 RepID=A0AAD7X3S4_9APHY|nr:hypothetical protein ONZ51_g11985 [Trametes cubensis]